jgi:hypothetical protein
LGRDALGVDVPTDGLLDPGPGTGYVREEFEGLGIP